MRKLLAIAIVASAILAAGLTAPPVSADARPVEHCIRPDGTDLNELYRVNHRIVTRFCPQVLAGERWVAPAVWLMAPTFESVPDEFVAAGATPRDDFLAKFTAVRYVVDEGTRQERTYVVPSSGRLWIGELDGFPTVNTVTLASLHPLSVGQHTVDVYWRFDAMHCDGFAANVFENCFPAGETQYSRTTFEVTNRA